jgi:hypothetical protein
MRKLSLLLVLLPLVAVWVYGCNESTPTETATIATDASIDFEGTRRPAKLRSNGRESWRGDLRG